MRKFFLIIGLSFSVFFISCSGPEDKLAGHIDDIAEIMSENESDPENLVDEMDEYFDSNFGDILAAFGEAFIELQDLDPQDREERMAEMAFTVYEAIERNEGIFKSFSERYVYERGYYDKECQDIRDQNIKDCERRNQYKDYYDKDNCYEIYGYDEDYCWIEGEMSDDLENLVDAIEDKYDEPPFDVEKLFDELQDVGLKKPSKDFARAIISIGKIFESLSSVRLDNEPECDDDCRDKQREFERSWDDVFDRVYKSMK